MESRQECQNDFKWAATLLQHFADHVNHASININDNNNCLTKATKKQRKIPDLRPINIQRRPPTPTLELENDSGVDEDVNPLKFCAVTMSGDHKQDRVRKYQCTYCGRRFGWPTDLKRHILIHTGERPFQCSSCDCSFTRNFLLKKHQRKCHLGVKVPDLTPIGKKSISKQEKGKNSRVGVPK